MVDLRSDTLTRPTPAMRQAMAEAVVGDDVYGEDPTVNALEAETAALLGKDAAVFMPTGTMTNQVALRAHTEPGDAVLMDQTAHIYLLEGGAPFALSGIHPRLLPGVRGVFAPDDVEAAIPRPHPFSPKTLAPPSRLLCLENTHNVGGGRIWPLDRILAVTGVARAHGLARHLDGARLWNAAVATGIAEREFAAPFDSVSVCFSKGLGAPVGSALAGTTAFVERARRFRAQFGGAMRQAGVIAAAALHALRHHRARLAEDHANAKRLAEGIAGLPGIDLDPAHVETNIVRFNVTSMTAGDFVVRLHDAGVRMLPYGANGVRAITHLDVSRAQIAQAIEGVRTALAAVAR